MRSIPLKEGNVNTHISEANLKKIKLKCLKQLCFNRTLCSHVSEQNVRLPTTWLAKLQMKSCIVGSVGADGLYIFVRNNCAMNIQTQ